MEKSDELKEVYSEKQRRWACSQINTKKGERVLPKEKAIEMCKDIKHSKKNPSITKGKLVEYILNKSKL